jgi:hypothetical protein
VFRVFFLVVVLSCFCFVLFFSVHILTTVHVFFSTYINYSTCFFSTYINYSTCFFSTYINYSTCFFSTYTSDLYSCTNVDLSINWKVLRSVTNIQFALLCPPNEVWETYCVCSVSSSYYYSYKCGHRNVLS